MPTNGRIASGAIIEREVPFDFAGMQSFRLALRNPDFTTARRIAAAVNKRLGPNAATPLDSGTVQVDLAHTNGRKIAAAIGDIEQLEVTPDLPTRVVIDEQAGVIVMGNRVRISTVAIAQGNLTIRVTETTQVSQPNPLSNTGDTVTIDYEASSTGQIGTTFQTISIDGQSIQTDIRDGKLQGLLEVRDKVLPNLHSELDALAAKTRDVLNHLHNRGMGFPAANSLSGARGFTDTATETVTLYVDIRVATTSNNGLIKGHFDLPAGAYTLDDMATAL